MKIFAASLFLVLIMFGCTKKITGKNQPSGAGPKALPEFELRDFSVDRVSQKGRGTLVAKDEMLKVGTYLVYLSAKQVHRDNQHWTTTVILRDGYATVETSDRVLAGFESLVNYTDWEIIGFVKLEPGVILRRPD